MKAFADRLKTYQNSKGLKQSELAKIMGIAPGTLSGYLSDKNNPQINDVARFAEAMGVSIGWLCGENAFDPGSMQSFADLFEAIDGLLSIKCSSEDDGRLFDLKIHPEKTENEERDLFAMESADPSVVEYYKSAQSFMKMYREGILNESQFKMVIDAVRKQYETRLLDDVAEKS